MAGSIVAGDRKGITLLEILIAVAIVGILVTLAVSTFREMNEKYKVEAETKQLYADLMDVRGRAVQRNRFSFVRISATGYATYVDNSPAPDGNRQCEPGADERAASVTLRHPVTASLTATGTPDNVIFNRQGIASGTGYIRISVSPGINVTPDYDCISIRETRLRTGRYTSAGGGSCDEK